MNVQLNGGKMEELKCSWYIGVDRSSDGGIEVEWKHRVCGGRNVTGALQNVWKWRKVTTASKMGKYNGIIAPSVLYGSEAWGINAELKRKADAFEMS